jgi:hypothetical protein
MIGPIRANRWIESKSGFSAVERHDRTAKMPILQMLERAGIPSGLRIQSYINIMGTGLGVRPIEIESRLRPETTSRLFRLPKLPVKPVNRFSYLLSIKIGRPWISSID